LNQPLSQYLRNGQRDFDDGSRAVAALPIVQMAARVLAEMATFDDAGVSRPAGEIALA
jgi:nicotinate-nucleotide--dimethylbenzimidazole phosphoribosyltransferase